MIRLLVVTTLFPNSIQPRHGIFVATRLDQLLKTGHINAEVIAPVPWFPFSGEQFGRYGLAARVPRIETRNGLTVHHPRYLVIPKIGMLLTPFTLAFSIWRCMRKLHQSGAEYDLLDAHYFYPDGVAAALVSSLRKTPLFITARGSDINLIGTMNLPRKLMLWAAKKASACIAVCDALRNRMIGLGMAPEKISVLRNGVDTHFFKCLPRISDRQESSSRTILSVGNLVELKGHHLVIEALRHLPDCKLVIVGDGVERQRLSRLAEELGLVDRVQFLGTVSQKELVGVYNAADVLVLASSSEGMPNVLLESIACGTPVVTTDVGGAREVVDNVQAGRVLKNRTPEAIASGIRFVLDAQTDPADVRKLAEKLSWDETVQNLFVLIQQQTHPQAAMT